MTVLAKHEAKYISKNISLSLQDETKAVQGFYTSDFRKWNIILKRKKISVEKVYPSTSNLYKSKI